MPTPRPQPLAPRLRRLTLLVLLVLLVHALMPTAGSSVPHVAAAALATPTSTPTTSTPTTATDIQSVIPESLPLLFEPNAGRYDSSVKYLTHSFGGTLTFSPAEVVMTLPMPHSATRPRDRFASTAPTPPQRVRLAFAGANPAPTITSLDRTAATMTIATGADAATWRQDLPTYSGVVYHAIYPGVDLRYEGHDGRLKSTYTVAPGAAPSQIRLRYDGVEQLVIDSITGDLHLTLPRATTGVLTPTTIVEHAPLAWQELNGVRSTIAARYVVNADGTVSFVLAPHDDAAVLTIDPTVTVNAVGSVASQDIALDTTAGRAYIAGSVYDGSVDAVVATINLDTLTQEELFYLHGQNDDAANGVAVDHAGAVYVTGSTNSNGFLGSTDYHGGTCGFGGYTYACTDIFVVRLSRHAQGLDIDYATLLGGTQDDAGYGIAVDADGDAYVAGRADYYAHAYVARLHWDAVNLALSQVYAVTLSGDGSAIALSIALDDDRNAYIVGSTVEFVEYDTNGYVAKLNSTGATLWQQSFGGRNPDEVYRVTLDRQRQIYLTGVTYSTVDFPLVNPLPVEYPGGSSEGGQFIGFAAMLTNAGAPIYRTLIAGDTGNGIAVDSAGRAYIATNRMIRYDDGSDQYLGVALAIEPQGAAWGYDQVLDMYGAVAIALDAGANAYVAGDSAVAKVGDNLSPITVEITDAQGKVVRALKNNDEGWPVLDADTGAVANPLTVKVTVHKQSDADTALAIHFGSPDATTRFYPTIDPEPDRCATQESFPDDAATTFSYRSFLVGCDLRLLATGASQSFSWRVWIQPSNAEQFVVSAKAFQDANGIIVAEEQAEVDVPQARIRPVVVVPGIIGTFPTRDGWKLDPMLGTYDRLVNQLRMLGYEDDLTLIPFIYSWYGNLKTGNPNNVPELAAQLSTLLGDWWTNRTPPAYVRTSDFDLIAHSTGGLITRYYVSATTYGQKINTAVLVGVPNQGAPKAFAAWEGLDPILGYNAAKGEWETATNVVGNKLFYDYLKKLSNKAGCGGDLALDAVVTGYYDNQIYRYIHGEPCLFNSQQPGVPLLRDLLPSTASQDQNADPYLFRDGVILQGPANPLLDYLNRPELVNSFVQRITAEGHLFSMYSTDLQTWKGYNVEQRWSYLEPFSSSLWMNQSARPLGWSRDWRGTNRFPGYLLTTQGDPDRRRGDGTVPVWSADIKRLVTDTTLQGKVNNINLEEGIDHGGFFKNDLSLRKMVLPLLDPSIDPKQPSALEAALPLVPTPSKPNLLQQGDILVFANECPVSMLITDSQGRRVGTTSDGQDVNEIPGSLYTGRATDGGPEFILIAPPPTGVYTVTVTGIEAGNFTITAQVFSQTATTRLGYFTGQLQPGQVATHTTALYATQHSSRRLLVDDQAGSAVQSLYQTALAQLGPAPDVWDTAQRGQPTLSDLYPYDTIVWATGPSSSFSTDQLRVLTAYINEGGAALLTGQDVDTGISDTVVLSQTLRASVANPSVDSRVLQGADLFNGLTLHLNGGDGANNQTTPSAIQPLGGAVALAQYTDGTGAGQAAGLRYATTDGRLIYLSFGLEGLETASERTSVLDRALRWLDLGEMPDATSTPTPTSMPTATATSTPTSTPTATPTSMPTATATSTPTSLPTATATSTPTSTPTATPTSIPTATATATSTPTATPTNTPTATATSTPTSVPTLTATPTNPGAADTIVVRHAPTLNGAVDGSLRQLLGEDLTINGGGSVSGDLLLPGSPNIRQNGKPSIGAIVAGTGNTQPSSYQVTLNGNAKLGRLLTRIDPVSMQSVAAPPRSSGTRDLVIDRAGQPLGDPTTLRNLTLNSNAGVVTVPPGTYGQFTANSGTAFVLGVAGATEPAVYNLQGLTLNGQSELRVVGPVVLILANSFTLNGSTAMGSAEHPTWLTVNVATGTVALNGGSTYYGVLRAPSSTVTLNGNSRLRGSLTADRLTLNSGASVQGL